MSCGETPLAVSFAGQIAFHVGSKLDSKSCRNSSAFSFSPVKIAVSPDPATPKSAGFSRSPAYENSNLAILSSPSIVRPSCTFICRKSRDSVNESFKSFRDGPGPALTNSPSDSTPTDDGPAVSCPAAIETARQPATIFWRSSSTGDTGKI